MKKQGKTYEFEAIFTTQDEGGFTVEIPDLPGCISEGDTIEEAEKNIQEAAELYLQELEERGIPLPNREPLKVLKMNITIPRVNETKKEHA